MTESDLKYLPFTQVKDILEEKPAVQARSARISPDPQQRRVDQQQQQQGKFQSHPRSDNINQSNSGQHDPLVITRIIMLNIAGLSRQ